MKGGWLEHEIRSLPQVLACSITTDDLVVLVDASADPVTVEQRVRDVLRRTGLDLPVRVYGGERPVYVEPMRVRNGRAALVGSLGGAALLAAGVWFAGATTALRGPRGKETVITLAPPPPKKLVLIPMVGGGEAPSPPLPAQETAPPPLLRPVKRVFPAGERRMTRPAATPAPAPATDSPSPEQEPSHPHLLLPNVGAMLDKLIASTR